MLQPGAQTLCDLDADLERPRLRDPAQLFHEVIQRSVGDEFHRKIYVALIRAVGIHADDVRVVEGCGDFRLALKLADELLIIRILRAEDFQRDEAVQVVIHRSKHKALAAAPDELHQFVVAEVPAHINRRGADRARPLREYLRTRHVEHRPAGGTWFCV